MINIFKTPQKYREELLKQENWIKNRKNLDGKSFICVFFTSYCCVGCPFCFFKSPLPHQSNWKTEMQAKFNEDCVQKFIKFANDSNVGYLQISGGGEPFLEKNAILECVEKVDAQRIILVTSGYWASGVQSAKRWLEDLDAALKKRKTPTRLTIRLSVSEYHAIRLQDRPVVNLLNIFSELYKNRQDFTLQIKTFLDDNNLVESLNKNFKNYSLSYINENISDDSFMKKVIPWGYYLTLESGYKTIVGVSRVFNSTLRPNLLNNELMQHTIDVYDLDLEKSQNFFPSIVENEDGTQGIDWIVEYNGNVCSWQNRVQDNLLNIYEDSYEEVLNKTYGDLITYSFIDKGSVYRENIIKELSEKTVTLMKSVGIRDYAGTLLFEDEKIRLYYNIRVLQDYIKENNINEECIKSLSKELQYFVGLSKEELIKYYNSSDYSLVDQEFYKFQDKEHLRDFLELIKMGHFELKDSEIKKALKFYNKITGSNIKSLNDIQISSDPFIERRLTDRVMDIKDLKVFHSDKPKHIYLFRHGETNLNIEKQVKGQLEDVSYHFTENGLKQIQQIANQLKEKHIEAIVSSDIDRALDSAALANSELNLPISIRKIFRGLNMGEFQGLTENIFLNDERVKKAFKDYSIKIPGGESINELNQRLIAGLIEIAKNTTYNNIAIFSHGAAISNLNAYLQKKEYKDINYCHIIYDKGNFYVENF